MGLYEYYIHLYVHVAYRQPLQSSSAPVLRHTASVTSSRQSLVSDVTAGESPGAAPDDDVIDNDESDSPLEKDIVRRRIDLFENQVKLLF